ncbi:hypothetical protein SteCoe_10004 [Stentor coeruleus]|uniref:Uncharacterized protein n=1 Tax=Stentor coeruleus TaxID=5963 RepID=A0A1R2CGP2_9CILI|nr:hypothetical protein SteCoe_10004 [Stentor coeruleus]
MKEKLSDQRLPRKRFRANIKEDDSKKKPITTEELEKIKKFNAFIDQIIQTIDPFTVDAFDIPVSNISTKPSDLCNNTEYTDLYREYVQEPQKQKKKFAECKKRFDLVMNKEDPEQDILMTQRFNIYNKVIPINNNVQKMLGFLENLNVPDNALERKKVQIQALMFKEKSSDECKSLRPEKKIAAKILEIDPPPSGSLCTQEKLALLRALAKHMGDWEKISKEFKDKPVPGDLLRKIWRCLKVTMKEEVIDIRKKAPQYHYIKWLRAAVRKLEQNNGKKHKQKTFTSINPKPKEHRFDMLSVMAEAENTKCSGIESSTSLNITSSSSFKVYSNSATLKELCN